MKRLVNVVAFIGCMPLLVASMVALLPLAAFAIIYYWLYPERHARMADAGTEEERVQLAKYRAALAGKPFLRRLCEKIGIAESSDPPPPGFTHLQT